MDVLEQVVGALLPTMSNVGACGSRHTFTTLRCLRSVRKLCTSVPSSRIRVYLAQRRLNVWPVPGREGLARRLRACALNVRRMSPLDDEWVALISMVARLAEQLVATYRILGVHALRTQAGAHDSRAHRVLPRPDLILVNLEVEAVANVEREVLGNFVLVDDSDGVLAVDRPSGKPSSSAVARGGFCVSRLDVWPDRDCDKPPSFAGEIWVSQLEQIALVEHPSATRRCQEACLSPRDAGRRSTRRRRCRAGHRLVSG